MNGLLAVNETPGSTPSPRVGGRNVLGTLDREQIDQVLKSALIGRIGV